MGVPMANATAVKMEELATPRTYQMYSTSFRTEQQGSVLLGKTLQERAAPAFNVSPTPPITAARMGEVGASDLTFLAKKLVHLSILLEQDTVCTDTAYPSFASASS